MGKKRQETPAAGVLYHMTVARASQNGNKHPVVLGQPLFCDQMITLSSKLSLFKNSLLFIRFFFKSTVHTHLQLYVLLLKAHWKELV